MKEEIGRTIKLFLFWCLLFLAPIIMGGILCDIFSDHLSYDIMGWSSLMGSMLIVIVFLSKRYVKFSFGHIKRRMIWSVVGISVLISVANLLALMSFFELIHYDLLFSEATEQMKERSQEIFSGIAAILYGSIFGPIAEEMGFRGVLLGGLLNARCRPWLSILISAFVFGLFHGFMGFFGAMTFGIILGWLYWRTQSIIPCIIIHIVSNSLSFIDLSGQTNVVCLLILLACLLALGLGIWWFWKNCTFEDELHQ